MTPFHSWNSAQRTTNYFLFKLQRHSDHHAIASKRYQVLRSYKASPTLPTGYGGCILMAIFAPWIWFRVMDPRAVRAMEAQRAYKNSGVNPFVNE